MVPCELEMFPGSLISSSKILRPSLNKEGKRVPFRFLFGELLQDSLPSVPIIQPQDKHFGTYMGNQTFGSFFHRDIVLCGIQTFSKHDLFHGVDDTPFRSRIIQY